MAGVESKSSRTGTTEDGKDKVQVEVEGKTGSLEVSEASRPENNKRGSSMELDELSEPSLLVKSSGKLSSLK